MICVCICYICIICVQNDHLKRVSTCVALLFKNNESKLICYVLFFFGISLIICSIRCISSTLLVWFLFPCIQGGYICSQLDVYYRPLLWIWVVFSPYVDCSSIYDCDLPCLHVRQNDDPFVAAFALFFLMVVALLFSFWFLLFLYISARIWGVGVRNTANAGPKPG